MLTVAAHDVTDHPYIQHKSAVMTLDVYAGLFDDDLDALAARMDVSDADVEQMWNSADVIELPTARNPL